MWMNVTRERQSDWNCPEVFAKYALGLSAEQRRDWDKAMEVLRERRRFWCDYQLALEDG